MRISILFSSLEIEVKGAEEVLRLVPFFEIEAEEGQTEEKLPEDRLPEELREFFIDIKTPADILDESINNELTDNLLAAQSAFSSLLEENERMEEEIVETKKKIENLENERMMLRKIKQEIEVKGAEEVLRLVPFFEIEAEEGQTEEKLPEDRLPEELREFFIEIKTPADILDESINNELTDNLLAAQSAFSSLLQENKRMEEEIVETKKKIENLENERMMLYERKRRYTWDYIRNIYEEERDWFHLQVPLIQRLVKYNGKYFGQWIILSTFDYTNRDLEEQLEEGQKDFLFQLQENKRKEEQLVEAKNKLANLENERMIL
ncbi:hypothetical protein QYM36_020092, partial [Artemia franciscana]